MDVVLKFRMLVLQSLHGLSLKATETHGPGPAQLDAVLQARHRRPGAGREHALEFGEALIRAEVLPRNRTSLRTCPPKPPPPGEIDRFSEVSG